MKLRNLLLSAFMLIALGSMAQLSPNVENDPSSMMLQAAISLMTSWLKPRKR